MNGRMAEGMKAQRVNVRHRFSSFELGTVPSFQSMLGLWCPME